MTILIAEQMKTVEAIFSQGESIAFVIKSLIDQAEISIDMALYSFSSAELFRALRDAQKRGIQVRLPTDWSKYEQSDLTSKLQDASQAFDTGPVGGYNGQLQLDTGLGDATLREYRHPSRARCC